MRRRGEAFRQTRETRVEVTLALDGRGEAEVVTGIPFFDHLLAAFTRHGFFDLAVKASGDLEVDPHHTVEDTGICLGRALRQALGTREGLRRFGWSLVPMDDALALAAVDLVSRSYLGWEVPVAARAFGGFHTDLAPEFWKAVVGEAQVVLHLRLLAGTQPHHCLEAVWKAAGLALSQAVALEERAEGALSTKGEL